MEKLAIHESKNSDKVVKFLTAETELALYNKLLELVSKKTAEKIIKGIENGSLFGVYYTKTGKIRAAYA